MKKIISLVVVIAAFLLLAFTCPDKQAHQDKIKVTMSSLVEEQLNKEATSDEEKGFALLGSLFATKMVDIAMEQKLNVNNYIVCSIGEVTFEGKTHYISFGILNQVFVLGKDKMKQAMNDYNK